MSIEVPMMRLGSAYLLEERIGSGAQGDVWEGRAEGSDEVLAFKILRPEITRQRSVIDAFLKERDTLERVDSPFVVRLRDVVVEGQTLGLVMDYVGGGDLGDVLRASGTLAPAMVAWYGAAIATGLSAIHAAGLVHRDMKPVNILLDNTVSPAAPRVADFGVAQICESAGSTQGTAGVGTPAYMAPEVAEGLSAAPSMDIYSLGVVLYELACGCPPFVGNPIAVIKAHATRMPGRPDGIPDPLWQLISVMLAKDPAARPTADQVAQWLTAMCSTLEGLPAAPLLQVPPMGEPTVVTATAATSASAATGESVHKAPEKRKGKKGLVAVLAVLLVALLAGGGYVVMSLRDQDEPVATATSAEPEVAEETASTPTSTATSTPTPSPTPSPTATRMTTMPDLVGMTQRDAEAALPDDVTVTVVKKAAPNGEKAGTVLATDPQAGADLPDSVTLTVASAMETIYLSDLNTLGYDGMRSEVVNVNGQSYAHGLRASMYRGGVTTTEWNLGRYFTSLTGTIGMTDTSGTAEATFTVDFYLDQVLVQTETIRFGEFKDISLDATDGLRLKIVVTRTDDVYGTATIGFGDFALQGDPAKVPDLSDLNGR